MSTLDLKLARKILQVGDRVEIGTVEDTSNYCFCIVKALLPKLTFKILDNSKSDILDSGRREEIYISQLFPPYRTFQGSAEGGRTTPLE